MQESKQETQFRIGGVYRRRDGVTVRLVDAEKSSNLPFYAGTIPVAMCNVASGNRVGFVRLSDGMRRQVASDKNSGWHLIPGELHQVDGQWLPLDAQEESDLPELVKNFQERELRKADPTPADLAMIARDDTGIRINGKPWTRPEPVVAPAPLITTKPPIAGLTRVSAQDHRVGGWGFVR